MIWKIQVEAFSQSFPNRKCGSGNAFHRRQLLFLLPDDKTPQARNRVPLESNG
jgi:hypothetical protein